MPKNKKGTRCKHHSHRGVTHFHKILKTKRRTKDIDQIHNDLKKENIVQLLNQTVNYEVTGNAQHYCVHCARYFADENTLQDHFRTKPHKRRLKELRTEPFTQEEANRAAGMGSYKFAKTLEIKTQPDKKDLVLDEDMAPVEKV